MTRLHPQTPDVSVVLPVYFNQENLPRTLASLKAEVVERHPKLRFELIFVDDGSRDRSLEILLALQQQHPSLIRVIKLTRNFGQVGALWCGYTHARGQYVASMSADGQDPAYLVNDMLNVHLEEHRDVVICARQERDESLYRVATSWVFYSLIRHLSFPNMPAGGFDVVSMSRRAVDVFLSTHESQPFFQGQVLWMGFDPKVIPYARQTRQGGQSRWTFGKKLTYLIDGVLSYSYAPLRMMSIFGLCVATSGFVYALLIAILRIIGELPQVGLLTPMLVAVLVLGGIQMLMIGVIGEYVWRTLAQSRTRPLYIVDRIFDAPEESR